MVNWSDFYSISAYLSELNLLSTFVRLMLAMIFGGVIGMERGRRRRAAGLRTHILVCIGATLVMITNQYIVNEFGTSDPARMGAQVISGIGFLGVGTIIVDRQQQVRGLTTAAGLWASACMGLALGIGFYSGALIAFIMIMGTIMALNRFEYHMISKSRSMELYAEFNGHGDINPFLNYVTENRIQVIHLEIIKPRDYKGSEDLRAAAVLTLRLPKRRPHEKILENLDCIDGLLTIEELR